MARGPICHEHPPASVTTEPHRYCHLPLGHHGPHRAMVRGPRGSVVTWPAESTQLIAVIRGLLGEGWRIQARRGDIEHPGLEYRAGWRSIIGERTGKRVVVVADERGDIQSWGSCTDASVP
jgi:hypothetical protein